MTDVSKSRLIIPTSIAFTAALFSIGIAASDASAATPKQLVVVERATTDSTLDLGAKGDSAGDVLTFANEIFDKANKEKIGADNGYCVRVVAGKAWECIWTLTLAKGQITVEGPFLDSGDSTLAITGGTGEYAHVRGDMLLHARNSQGSEYDFTYNLRE
ncbi:MAG: allene oxide cyclase family protein [Parvibaculum sp.]|uniref:allene oxide cyclase family protein n=1 Tax=Parvibaculum sp. TaxID=2024848 RepID=UPI003C74E0A1